MPELPEVETVRRGLVKSIKDQAPLKFEIHQPKLRYPISKNEFDLLIHCPIQAIERRGKYLLFYCNQQGGILTHLGMSGSLCITSLDEPIKKHDHVIIHFEQFVVRYNDPRRFGFMMAVEDFANNPLLTKLGAEPLSKHFNAKALHQRLAKKQLPIKSAIMDQQIVVGVGNIYACEALYQAQIHPLKPACQLSNEELTLLVTAIKKILKKAIHQGGTTLNDFKNAEGKPGYFKQELFVYGRQGETCLGCEQVIEATRLQGRSTFYCRGCQQLK